jgi:hypothetical protein
MRQRTVYGHKKLLQSSYMIPFRVRKQGGGKGGHQEDMTVTEG